MNRKTQSKPPAPPVQLSNLSPEEEQQLDFDICCCIEEIEIMLSKNPPEKQRKLAEVSLKILKNPGESLIKKKQAMRQLFGDYRKKFDSKKKQMISSLKDNKVNFKPSASPQKSIFYRKHCGKLKNEEDVNFDSENLETENNKVDGFSFKHTDNSFKFGF